MNSTNNIHELNVYVKNNPQNIAAVYNCATAASNEIGLSFEITNVSVESILDMRMTHITFNVNGSNDPKKVMKANIKLVNMVNNIINDKVIAFA